MIQPLLPDEKPAVGRPSISHRHVLNAILWFCRTAVPWRDLPMEYQPWATIASRFYRWQKSGVLQALFIGLRETVDIKGALDWEMHCVDSTVIRAHQHAAGGRVGIPRALGRSRGGFGTKIHLKTDGAGLPIAFTTTGGEKHDAPQLVKLMDIGKIKRIGRGRPRLRPKYLAGGKGYDSEPSERDCVSAE